MNDWTWTDMDEVTCAEKRAYAIGVIAAVSVVVAFLLAVAGCGSINVQDVIDAIPTSTTVAPVTTTIPPPTSTTVPPWEIPNYEAQYEPRDILGTNCPCIQSQAWAGDKSQVQDPAVQFVPKKVQMRDENSVVLGLLSADASVWHMHRDIKDLPSRFWIDFYYGTNIYIYYIPDSKKNQLMMPVKL